MTNPVSRAALDHPAQSTTGDASLYSRVEALYFQLGNHLASRWIIISSLANGATTTGRSHGLRVPFPVLGFFYYTAANANDDGTGELTPIYSGVTVVPTSGNATTQVDVTNNTGGTLTNLRILVLQTSNSFYQRIVDPSLTAGGNVYATLADAISGAVAGDKILVRGTETITAAVTINKADLTIEWSPGAKTVVGSGSTQTVGLVVNGSGPRCRLIAPYLRLDNTTTVYGYRASGQDIRISDGIMQNNGAGTVTAALQVNSGGERCRADIGIIESSGTVTNDFEDNVGTLRGSFAR